MATHTLEAVVISAVMVSAVAYVATFQSPPTATQGSRALVESHARDALSILADTPVFDSDLGTNEMSVSTMECLQGDCSRLQAHMETLLPNGSRYAVYLSNGHGLYPVYAPATPPGESVSSEHLFEPQWSYSFVGPAMDSVNPTYDPVVVYDLPVVNSNVLSPSGNVLDVVLHGMRTGDHSEFILRTTGATRAALAADASTTPAASLYFVNATGDPVATYDARSASLASGIPTKVPFQLTVRLNETAGVALPAGTNLTVHVPRGWLATASSALNPSWNVLANATDWNASSSGSDVVATLKSPLASGAADLAMNVTYYGDQDDDYLFRAVLSQGSYAAASVVVVADDHGSVPGFEVPGLHLSAPRPMGATATTTWTLAVLVPETSGATLADSVLVDRIDIKESEGAPIFASVTNVSGDGGAWTTNGSALTWTGSRTLTHASPLNLTFRVAASGLAGTPVERAPYTPSVSLEGWEGRLQDVTSPGLYRQALLPSDLTYRGYNSSTGSWLEANHTATSTAVYRATALPGNFTYTTGYFALLRDSVFGSDLSVESRRVPVGGSANVTANVQSVAYQLAELGAKPVITLDVYPPWSASTRTPIWSQTLYDAPALLGSGTFLSVIDANGDGTPEASQVGKYNVTIPVDPTWLFGPYVLDAKVTWSENVSATVGGVGVTAPLLRNVHVYDYFLVTPPDSVSPASPIYSTRLVVWFDDWN